MNRAHVYRRWVRRRRAAIAPLIALSIVAGFWIIGLSGGIRYLHAASSPLTMLAGLYIMLAAIALSIIIIITAALSRLADRVPR